MKNFIITIDTEGDNMWRLLYTTNFRHRITNRNGEYIERFQLLCEKYGFVPTYLVNYEMSLSKPFVELAREGLKKETLEIGMHMHAWNCPPYYELKKGKKSGGKKPYIGEYPEDVIRRKVDYLTKQLQDVFQTGITSHRSGRWYLDKKYIAILRQFGYIVDCSVTPGIDWSKGAGLTEKSKGTNYRGYPRTDYEISLKNIKRSGESGIYEVPVTIETMGFGLWGEKKHFWLRPDGKNLDLMKKIVFHQSKKSRQTNYVEFMLHSSELMPGGSPTFKTEKSIEQLYEDMALLFSYVRMKNYQGIALTEYIKRKYNVK